MSFAAFPFASAPFASWEVSSAAFVRLVRYGTTLLKDVTYLVEIDAYRTPTDMAFPPGPFGSFPFAGLPFGTRIESGVETFGFSDTGWIGEPDDPHKPNKLYLGRVRRALQYERVMPVLPEQERRLALSFGSIEVALGDREVDALINDYAVAGRRVRVLRGARSVPVSTRYADFDLVLSALAAGWEQDEYVGRLQLRDASYRLELPFQRRLYKGTGGAEGGAEWKGKPMPVTLGFRRNIAPDLIDPQHVVYRVSDGRIRDVVAVRDGGMNVPRDTPADYPTYADLIAATIAAGHYATCRAEGLWRAATAPTFMHTCDVEGDADPAYVDTHPAIARRVLARALMTDRDYDAASFDGWPNGTAGLHIGSTEVPTVADVLSRIAASVAGSWGTMRDGRVVAMRLIDPDLYSPDLVIDQRHLKGPPQLLPQLAVPRFRQRVGYQALQVVQDTGAMAAGLDPADRQYYSEPYRVAEPPVNTDTLLRYRFPLDPPPLISLFDAEADARALAVYLLALHGVERRMFRVPLGAIGLLIDRLGKVVRFSYPAFGLDDGKNFVVVGASESDHDVELTLWG